MRWDELFADLEAQLVESDRKERQLEVADRTRRERAEVAWLDRAAVSLGRTISVTLWGSLVRGTLIDLGRDWLLIDEVGRLPALVPAEGVTSISGLGQHSNDDPGRSRRFGLGVALRAVGRDRAAVAIHDRAGGLTTGTIDRVGADHVDVAEHPADSVRREAVITGHRVIPFGAIAVVRRA